MNKQCTQCSKTFRIDDQDFGFYKKIDVPQPTLCPDCRAQRRFAFRNERFFYQRKCDLTGKPIVTVYSPAGPVKQVYEREAWFGDGWSALDYGRSFDFNRPFFEQFAELMYDVPHPALWNWDCENSEYNHCCYQLKNSYMNTATDKSEEAYYSNISVNCQTIADCMAVEESEIAIECIDSDNLYNAAFCQQCRNCMNAYLSFDCHGCKYIFGCTGLRNKEYMIFNEQVTPAEWERRIPELLGNDKKLHKALQQAKDTGLAVPRMFNTIYSSENSTGNYIWNSVNCQMSYDVREGEDLKYVVYSPWKAKDGMDCYAIGSGELLYEANFGIPGYNNQFNMWLQNGPNNSQYNVYCVNNCDNVFGSVGLNKQKYVIFNKQYSKAEYFVLRDKIIQHMSAGAGASGEKPTGEYGEFFPAALSPFGYNETIAQEYYPLNKADVERNGWSWREDTGGTFGKETLTDIPESIHDATDAIINEVLRCIECNKNYKLVKRELEIYQQVGLALPRMCSGCRHLRRIELRNPRRLWQRQCMCTQPDHNHVSASSTQISGRCVSEFETTYSPDRKEIVYCKDCYQKEIY